MGRLRSPGYPGTRPAGHPRPDARSAEAEHAVDLAYADVFGAGGDGLALRHAFVAYHARPAAMLDAESALLAVREFVPAVADRLLDRVRDHYEVAAGVTAPGG